jgi:predicted Zn finger-like uncharacterized protein
MSKIETVCPFCKTPILVEKNSLGVSAHGLNKIQCSHCSKRWEEDLSQTGSLAKSAPADGMAAVRQRLIELGRVVDDYIARQAKFKPNGADQVQKATVLKFVAGMPEGMMLESDIADAAEAARQQSAFVTKAANNDATARVELQKALANGRPVASPNYVRAEDGLEKDAPSRFYTAESVRPGVQQYHNMPQNVERASTPAPDERRPFQPGGETDLNKAHAAAKHAVANGKRV